ncbi:hypothetical protein B1R32_106125 [Abditibacterium utsteinense]|uniref:Uncharacterized protein n=1 Tax=Abditibacterium utsteinense TaxID=1960156 RepID=A0A2S8SU51_9BACT|nr:hypothetical protein [Abditibacterium utsteinense]PQV64279.1 hypothetical protein B1R32_106125 [Abditibacterium utsteinense]
MNNVWSFLGHGGFKLLFFAFIIVGNIVKSRAKAAQKQAAKVRGTTAISDFSVSDNSSNSAAKPAPLAPSSPKSAAKSSDSVSASPWSSNQNPFN